MKKPLGQHFLRSRSTIRTVVDALPVPEGTAIVEVGPGKGALTEYLLQKGRRVIGIEKDAALFERLRETFSRDIADGTLILHNGDIRDCEWAELVGDMPYVVIANIPYYLTGTLIRDMLTRTRPPSGMALVVQKEVAERITGRNDSKESLLSLSVRLFGHPHYITTIPRTAFTPVPAVDSALISVTDIRIPDSSVQEMFFDIIHTAFHEKRKVVLKKFSSRPRVRDFLVSQGVDTTSRAENVPFSVWLAAAEL